MDKQLDALIAAHKADVHLVPDHVARRWHSAIDEAAAIERGRLPRDERAWHPTSFFWGVAVTAALAVGIGIGLLITKGSGSEFAEPPAVAARSATRPPLVPAAFSRGLQVHLRDSREQLAGVGAGIEDRQDQTAMILRIVEQNRMFEAAAETNNAPQLARVLRAFEPILLQLAATDLAPEDAEALRAQLAFELNVILTKLARESSKDSQTT